MSKRPGEVGWEQALLATLQHPILENWKSGTVPASKPNRKHQMAKAKRSALPNGLTRRQRTFVLEKLLGLNDKDAALAAGNSLSVAENTKQRIWKPQVRAEWERLRCEFARQGGRGA